MNCLTNGVAAIRGNVSDKLVMCSLPSRVARGTSAVGCCANSKSSAPRGVLSPCPGERGSKVHTANGAL
ncbi:hypothetical protein TNCV_4315951 [Trichonephila clavipes]|nr:hypothetical protein TNCV_4315951 [Trichonephila clavipes]